MFGDPVVLLEQGKTQPLGKLVKRITVGYVGTASDHYVEQGVPYLRTQNVRVNYIDLEGLIYVDEEFHRKNSKSIIHPDDVVISRVGANRGMAAVIPENVEEANIANCLIVGATQELLPVYLSHYFNYSYNRHKAFGMSVGSAQGVVNTGTLKKWQVHKPPLALQQEFAAFVQQVDKLKFV